MNKSIGRKILHFSLAMTAVVALAAIVNLLNGDSEAVARSQLEPQDKIAIIAVGPNATGDRIHAWVKNVGFGPISFVEEAEVIVTMPGFRLNTVKYSPAGGGNTWVEDPMGSSWDPGDTLHLIITLPAGSPLAADKQTFRVSTSKGAIADKSFGVR